MISHFHDLTRIFAVLALLGHLCACGPAMITAAGISAASGLMEQQASSFLNGELRAARKVTLPDALAATLAMMDELQIEARQHRLDEYDAYAMGRAPGGREIKIALRADSPLITKFSIRIGMMGDQAVSQLVLERIDEQILKRTGPALGGNQ